MSDNKIHDEEDYLDSLLKAVMSGNNQSSETSIDDEEDEFAKSIELDFENEQSEDDFLSEFENDILMSDDIPSPSESNNTDYMDIDEMFSENKDILSSAAGDIASISNGINEETDKPKRKGLFGRKKKIVIADNEIDNIDNTGLDIDDSIFEDTSITDNNFSVPEEAFVSQDTFLQEEKDVLEDTFVSDETVVPQELFVSEETDIPKDTFLSEETFSAVESSELTEASIPEETYTPVDDIFSQIERSEIAEQTAHIDDSVSQDYSSDNPVEESFNNINSIDDDLISAFEGLFSANVSDDNGAGSLSEDDFGINKSASGRPEEDINNLMDILGAFGESEGLSEDEMDVDVDKKGGKWKKKKKKKDKKEKKPFFSKKKNKAEKEQSTEGDMLNENVSPFDSAFASAVNNSIEDKPKDDFDFGFSLEEMGFSEDDPFSNNSISDYDENKDLMNKMDRGEIDEDDLLDDDEEELDKKKKKKEKKAKKPKKKAPKKKNDKKKKEKVRDRELDEIIPISKGFFFILLSLVVLFIVFLIFGGNTYHYNNKMQLATSMYVEKKYSEAYDALAGVEVKEDDMAFYNQIRTVMFVMRQYESGVSHIELNDYETGLHALVKGVKAYDKYQNDAREYKCFDDMTIVLGWINIKLNEVYGLTESEARELSLIDDKFEYAYKVRIIAKETMERMEEQKNDSNN